MNKRMKQILCCASVTAMTTLSLTGCSHSQAKLNTDKTSSRQDEMMGRYVETDIPLPDENTNYITVSETDDGSLSLLAAKDMENSLDFVYYTLSQDNTWQEESFAKLPCDNSGSIYEPQYCTNNKGEEYIFFNLANKDTFYCYLYTHNGDSWDEVKIDGWNDYDEENKYYKCPLSIGLLDDGNIIANYDGDLNIYDPAAGKLVKSLDYSCQDGYNHCEFYGDDILFTQYDTSYIPQNVCHYNYSDGSFTKVAFPSQLSSDASYHTYYDSASKNLYLINTEGIQLYQDGTSIWQVVADGSLTSLYLPTLETLSCKVINNEYYILCYIDSSLHLMKYAYDDSVPAVPNIELTIYSLNDRSMVRQAIVAFQQTHPDVRVTLNVAMDNSNSSSTQDYIRSLNTSLLAGKGDDILLLDQLPYDSFQEKGVLIDLADIIKPMVDSGELLENVMKPFEKDGHYYYVPTKMSLLMEHGQGNAGECTSLDSILDYAKSHTDNPVLGKITSSDLITTFLPVYLNSVTKEDGSLSEEDMVRLFEKMKELFNLTDGVSAVTGDINEINQIHSSIYDIASQSELNINNTFGFYDERFNLSVTNFVKGSFGNFENSFQPLGLVGINRNSTKQELAKEFIQLLYSDQIQSMDLFDGYPVKPSVIDKYMDIKLTPAYTDIQDASGNYVQLAVDDPTKEQKEKLISICKSASNCVLPDETVLLKAYTAAEDCLAGNSTPEQAVKKLINDLSLYTEE